jgi:hypothetical protein
VQVGMSSNSSVYPLYSPVYRFSATSTVTHSRSNILLTKDELQAANLPTGAVISAIQFYKVTPAAHFTAATNHKLYLGNSASTAIAGSGIWANIMAAQSLVYSNAAFDLPTRSGWITWDITPFTYTGGALEMASELVMVGNGGASGYITWQYSNTTGNNHIIGQTGTAPPDTLNGSNTNYLHRPNIRLVYSMALPMQLRGFTGMIKDRQVQLSWSTSQETGSSHFELERSSDGQHFSPVATVPAKGNSNIVQAYSYIDKEAVGMGRHLLHYRLQMVDRDGQKKASQVLPIRLPEEAKVGLQQAAGRYWLLSSGVKPLQYRIINAQGIVIAAVKVSSPSQELTQLEGLPHGAYMVQVIWNNGQQTIKLLK